MAPGAAMTNAPIIAAQSAFRERDRRPRAAGLAGACFDVCAGAYELTDAGVDIVTISKRLGRASPAITPKVYGQLFHKDGNAPEAINAALAGKGKD
jgi:hypothetical protein